MMASTATRPRFNLRSIGLTNLPISVNNIRRASPRKLTELMLQKVKRNNENLIGYEVDLRKRSYRDSRSSKTKTSFLEPSTDIPCKSTDLNTTFHSTKRSHNFYRTKTSVTQRAAPNRLALTGDSYRKERETSNIRNDDSHTHMAIRDHASRRAEPPRAIPNRAGTTEPQNRFPKGSSSKQLTSPAPSTVHSSKRKRGLPVSGGSRLTQRKPVALAESLFTPAELNRLGHLTNTKTRSAFVKNCRGRLLSAS